MPIDPARSAATRMPVLPSPALWSAFAPERATVSRRISPRMYDSVKRFEPTWSTGSCAVPAPASAQAASAARIRRRGTRSTRLRVRDAQRLARLAAEKLQLGKSRVQPALPDELRVRALGDDAAVVHHD